MVAVACVCANSKEELVYKFSELLDEAERWGEKPRLLTPFSDATDFQKTVAELMGSALYQEGAVALPFVEAQVEYDTTISTRFHSIQRTLNDTALAKLRPLVAQDSAILDVAGAMRYANFWGQNVAFSTLNVFDATYIEDAEGPCESVPREAFDVVTCLNYLLLAKEPAKALANIAAFAKGGALVIVDFYFHGAWFIGADGRHYHSFPPDQIEVLCQEHFCDGVLLPIGNAMWGLADYHKKTLHLDEGYTKFWKDIALHFSSFDRGAKTPCHYIFVGKRKTLDF